MRFKDVRCYTYLSLSNRSRYTHKRFFPSIWELILSRSTICEFERENWELKNGMIKSLENIHLAKLSIKKT